MNMKELKLKTLNLPVSPIDPKKSTTKDLLKIAVNNLPQGGITADEMRRRIKILDKIDEAGEEFLRLEDAVADELQKLVAMMRWTIVDKEILTFCDDVEHMTEVPK
jgi:hypothetical protein